MRARQITQSQTAWYSGAASGMTANNASSPANTKEPISTAAYAKELSAVFHSAAEKVLPSVVMITNRPAVVERKSDKRQ